MITKESEPVVRAYFKAVDSMQIEDLMVVFAEDASMHYPMSEPIVGRQAIREFYLGIFERYASGTDHIKRMFFSEDGGVAAEILFEATLKTGKEVVFEAVDLFTIKDGKIHKIQMNYDSAKVMQEVGPPPSQE